MSHALLLCTLIITFLKYVNIGSCKCNIVFRGVCRISQGGGPTLKFLRFWIYMPRSCEPLLGGFGGMLPQEFFLKMVQFRAF